MINGWHEKCGVYGVYGNQDDAARMVYFGLWALQHRGQESSGIVSTNGKRMYVHRGRGLVAHVYNEGDLGLLKGNIAIGHNRYSTSGGADDHDQPVYWSHNLVALAHNGNLPTVTKLKGFLKANGIPSLGLNDSEMMYKAIEYYLTVGKSTEEAVIAAYPLFTGAFSLLLMTKKELVAVRDPFGIRPLCIGRINGSVIFASETCALDVVGAEFVREVEPGEVVIVSKEGQKSVRLALGEQKLDVFEYIYFARPDSILLGQNVYGVRKRLGQQLAKEVSVGVDVVVPVPDSAMPAAIGYAQELGLTLEHALVKNRYIHRTFIRPAQMQRTSGVKMKLNVIREIIAGKKIGLVDDSIVRGTTSKRLADLMWSGGAKEVHLLIPSPPVYFPDFYGIDTPKQQELIAAVMSKEDLREYLGVNSLNYLSFDGMIKAIGIDRKKLCTSCFSGEYPIGVGSNKKKINFAVRMR